MEEVQFDWTSWLRIQRKRAIKLLLIATLTLGTLGLAASVYSMVTGAGYRHNLPIYLAAYLIVLALLTIRSVPDSLRAIGIVILLYTFSLFALYTGWLAGSGREFLVALIVLATVLVSPKAGIYAFCLSLVTYLVFALGFNLGWLQLEQLPDPVGAVTVTIEGIGFAIAAILAAGSLWFFGQALKAASQANQEAEIARGLLRERAAELETVNKMVEKRAEALAAAAEVARDVTSLLELDEILRRVAVLVRERFGFYFTGVFLTDEAGGTAVLKAMSSEEGDDVLPAGYSIKAGEPSIVANVVRDGKVKMVRDVLQDAAYLACPALPDTRGELALPLRAHDRVIGALDIQSRTVLEPGDNEAVLVLLADQIALAISNARLYQQAEESKSSFHSIVEMSGDGVAVIDGEGMVCFANTAAQHFFGQERPVIVGQPAWFPVVADEVKELHKRRDGESGEGVAKGDEEGIVELRVVETEWEGAPAYLAILRDITNRKLAEAALQQRTAQMETVRQVGLELASELDLDTLLYSIATRAMALVGGSDSSVALFRPELKSLEWVVGIADQSYIGNTVQRGDGLSGKVWESGEVIMVDNYNTWEGHVAIYLKDGRDALVGVPIIGGKQFLGVLEVEDRAPHTYSASDAELLKLLAAQAAVAIQNASLHEQVQLHAQDLEERVNLRTSELETKNQELGSFSYSVSHDLKAPLRGIDGYSRLLLETHADKLDEEGKEFLTNIRLGVNQMSQLIDDLLAFSRLERKPASFEPVDLAALVQSIVAKQADDLRSRKIELIVEVPRIMVSTDMEGLSQALRNLIDNAIKFTRDVPKPRIEIGGAETEGAWELWVRDNGIGFDMQYHERIFEIFQRLQRSEDYPGTGIGLAIVRKTVQQMGGRVWAESAPGLGAKFYIEIPKQDA